MSRIGSTTSSLGPSEATLPRCGVVAVITRGVDFLVIRRSKFVRSPGALCFPGGGLESGESESVALARELREELSAEARVICRLWYSTTPGGVRLAWWRAELDNDGPLRPNPAEVESIHWLSIDRLKNHPDVLPTNREFLAALARNEFRLD
jgi:8-oxo-dGTP diphosphatase